MKFWLFVLPALLICPELQARESYEATPALIHPGGWILFFNTQGPLSYDAPTHKEIPADNVDMGEVTGRSCQYGLSVPVAGSLASSSRISGAQGNGGYNQALLRLKQQHPDLRGIYDVKVDLQQFSILGIFSKLCTEITARGFR